MGSDDKVARTLATLSHSSTHGGPVADDKLASGREATMQLIVTLPNDERTTVSIKASNLRVMDLLAFFAAYALAPGSSVPEAGARFIPFLARWVQTLTDNQALSLWSVRVACGAGGKAELDAVVETINSELERRGRQRLPLADITRILGELVALGCLRPYPSVKPSWTVAEAILGEFRRGETQRRDADTVT